ncbi:MAG: 8-oxo-dGTP diphosphatase MutT [Firmicutes bacterium]|nr:8-oxo-dGTP diphosphatase MutT [Bacillota bacterium]
MSLAQADPVRVLITRRPAGTVYADYWEFPGGKVETGETIEQAVVRELAEELDIEVEPVAALEVVEHVYPHGHVVLHPRVCRLVAGEPRNLGVVEHCWVGVGELEESRFPEANDELIAGLRAWLRERG